MKKKKHYLARAFYAERLHYEDNHDRDPVVLILVGDLDYIFAEIARAEKHGTVKGVRLSALKKKTGKKRLFEKSEKKAND